MKVYFAASVHGRTNYNESYLTIVKTLKNLGCNVYADHILKTDVNEIDKQSSEEIRKVYKNLLDKIKEADLVVAEVSTPSVSVGHEVTEAVNLNKSVILLNIQGGNRAMLLEGLGRDKVQSISYTKENLEELLKKAVEESKKNVDVRFNFFVSPKILAYLDWVAQEKMIPRSVFLRNLIEREMKKDREFKG